MPFWWTNSKEGQKIQFHVDSEKENLKWSAGVNINNLGSVPIMLLKEDKSGFSNYKYDVKMSNGIQYVFFKKINADNSAFSINNTSETIDVTVC